MYIILFNYSRGVQEKGHLPQVDHHPVTVEVVLNLLAKVAVALPELQISAHFLRQINRLEVCVYERLNSAY